MDFIRVAYKEDKTGIRQFYPALLAVESQDLVVRGGQFAAIWDESTGLYNRKVSQAPGIIDRWFAKAVGEQLRPGDSIKKVREFDNQIFSRLMGLIRNIGDMGPELDLKLVFANETPVKADAATFRMGYSLSDAPHAAWDEMCMKLYGPEERLKFEYAIGSILTGASLYQHKAYVFFGDPGTGKSTIMNVIEKLFAGHIGAFKSAELGNASSQFSLEPFKLNPLVAIDHDADLSRIEINNLLNSIISHDPIQINSKGKSLFEIVPRSMLFIGTNKAVKITDSKSGLYRRMVDIHPTGETFVEAEYRRLVAAVQFELGAIAQHCINIFQELGPEYLSSYKPVDMMYRTNDLFNFVQEHRLVLEQGITLKHAWKLFTEWCVESDIRQVYKQYQFRDALKDYFKEWHEQIMIDGERHRSYFKDLRTLEKFSWQGLVPKSKHSWLDMEPQASIFDDLMADMPAQLSTGNDAHPLKQAWDKVTTKLSDIDTMEEHFVKVPTEHIVIDFDLKDADGNKSLAACLEAAALWPPTYAEPSRSGNGLHLHYDVNQIDVGGIEADHSPGIEIKTLLGGASLRRRFTVSNGLPVAAISSGLPIKEVRPVISATTMANEKSLRKQIVRNLNKETHKYTKPSMDMIKQVLDDAVAQGMVFDVSDMWDEILEFALSSSNQKTACMQIALSLPLKSEEDVEAVPVERSEKPIAYYDLEVYPNLFAIGYITEDGTDVVRMVNPTPQEVQSLIDNYRLIGFYNRLYDNHILWARTLGYSNQELFKLSQAIITENNRHKMFGAAYSLAYGDLYDILTKKQSLKKWEIELCLPHMEMDLPWDKDVPEDRVLDVLEYMCNDVLSTREVARANKQDMAAREILAHLSGLEVCNTANQHTAELVFPGVKETADELQYTDLRETFPGYEFDRFAPGKDKSTYKGIKVGEGGYVYAEPGMYNNVVLLDVASMHPTSIIELNLFGKYTENFKRLLDIRLLIKKGDYDTAIDLDPRLAPYLQDKESAKALSDALKLVINSVYGLTAASFPNKFKDERNIDNIVAKRGALFMVDLKEFVEKAGFKVAHIKTDSIKIPDATPEIIQAVAEFGAKYGYTFEHEATYEKFCLVNDAVYVCREDGKWSATGKQYQHPVVFKTMFSSEEIVPADYVEVKQVAKGHMYLVDEDDTNRQFVGKFGAFVPVLDGRRLLRIDGDKEGAVTGAKDFLWELDNIAFSNKLDVDTSYFQKLVDDGIANIEKHGSFSDFVK